MLTEYEAQKLQSDIRREADAPAKRRLLRDMRREPAWGPGVVLKCAACLLILVGLALIGTRVVESERKPPPLSAQAEKARTERATVRAEYHRKAVFDERKRTWEEQKDSEDRKITGWKDEP